MSWPPSSPYFFPPHLYWASGPAPPTRRFSPPAANCRCRPEPPVPLCLPRPVTTGRFRPEPRTKIMGGFAMSRSIATAWAQREFYLLRPRECQFELQPGRDDFTVGDIITVKVEPYGAKFKKIGEVEEELEWMIVTQSTPFDGNTGMDLRLIPQFQEGSREEYARELLAKEGFSEADYEFKTVLY
ncbi:hypothetical protein BDQ12DRAFT_727796 [Crucibulum laeve]|uniref:Uncharacterized protein n=1 Tax=Crucibulum laeve TaxID=68775 RepID=A0A5C3LKS9_9AGAR|nr:hypothetical protein BDQ12DRAFT_727796 [Crucibulum laeve]